MTWILAQRTRAVRRRQPPATNHGKTELSLDDGAGHRADAWPACAGQADRPALRREQETANRCSAIEGRFGRYDEESGISGSPDHAGISGAVDRRLIAQALTIRRTEERLLDLFAQGKLFGTVHTCIGQEWIGVAVANALKPGDFIFSNHRGHGHYIAWTDDVEGLIAEIMGRATGVCGGRGGSQHLCRDGFFSNGIQGGIAPIAAGLALARRLEGGGNIAVVYCGDGTLGQGVVYETLNIAAKWSLPLLIVVEDNGIAQSTPRTETLAGTVRGRAHAFGIDARLADTWDPQELIARTAQSARRVRQTRRPLLLHVRTYRLKAHSKGDDPRDQAEVASYAGIDTLNQLVAAQMPGVVELLAAIDHRLDHAVAQAEAAPFCEISRQCDQDQPRHRGPQRWRSVRFEPRRVVDAIREALTAAMAMDEKIILLGEDLRDPYGGAFKVTAGLSDRFGERVRNTPISEAAMVGIGTGLALAGWRPVVEIMFGDFLTLAADQFINHAAKFAWMYNERVKVPLVIRTPVGGYRGYGPTHSQCLEKHFLGVPGTRVLALHQRWCPEQLYRQLLADNDRPTLVIENKLLYGQRTDPTPPPGCELSAIDAAFPTIRIAPPGDRQLTIVAYGGLVGMAESAIAALADEELACDLLIPTQLYPLDIEPIIESVAQTHRVLVIEEGQGFAGFGSELITQLSCEGRLGPFRARRIHAAACPIPAAKPAEQAVLPSAEAIVRAAIDLVTGRPSKPD